MKFNNFKKAAISAFAVVAIGAGCVFAATPVAQQAYYDTFTFKVNGNAQFISDNTKKPFIANSRVYVPISTLSDLGISNVEWIPAANGMPATLNVSPVKSQTAGMDPAKEAYYEAKIKQLADDLAKKEAEVKTLTDENKKLKDEAAKAKTSSTSDDLKRAARDLADDFNRDRYLNRVDIGGRSFDISYNFYYGRSFEVEAYIKGLTSDDLTKLKKDSRNLDRVMEDVVSQINKDKNFRDVDKDIVVFDGTSNNNSKKVADYYERDGRGIRGGVTL